MIQNFDDFCREMLLCGFSMGGGNAKGIFALIDFDWQTQEKESFLLHFLSNGGKPPLNF